MLREPKLASGSTRSRPPPQRAGPTRNQQHRKDRRDRSPLPLLARKAAANRLGSSPSSPRWRRAKGSPCWTRRANVVGALSLGECWVTTKPPSDWPVLHLRHSLVISTFPVPSMSTVPSTKAKAAAFRTYSNIPPMRFPRARCYDWNAYASNITHLCDCGKGPQPPNGPARIPSSSATSFPGKVVTRSGYASSKTSPTL
jgi:hypothetical protein